MESQKGPIPPLLQIKTNTLYWYNWSTNWRKMIVYRNYRSNFLFVWGFHCNLLLRSLVGCISSSSSSSRACCIKTKVPTFLICHWLALKSTFLNSSFQSVSMEPKVGDPPWKMQRLQCNGNALLTICIPLKTATSKIISNICEVCGIIINY